MSPLLLPNVINPAVYTYRHEHIEVDPQGEPVIRLLIAHPVNQRGLVDLCFQPIPQIPWHWTYNDTGDSFMYSSCRQVFTSLKGLGLGLGSPSEKL